MNRATSQTPGGTEEDRVRRRRALGQAIRDYRREMPQADLGAKLGDIPQTTISRWERGLVDLTLEQIHDLEVVLNLVPGTLAVAGTYSRMTNDDIDPIVAIQNSKRIHRNYKDSAITTVRTWIDLSDREYEAEAAAAPKRRSGARR